MTEGDSYFKHDLVYRPKTNLRKVALGGHGRVMDESSPDKDQLLPVVVIGHGESEVMGHVITS